LAQGVLDFQGNQGWGKRRCCRDYAQRDCGSNCPREPFYGLLPPDYERKITLDGALAKNGVQGLVQGNGFDLINFLYIPKESGIVPGDAVVSTGLEGVFPQGLPIGTVTEVRTEKSGLFFRASIKPSSPPFGLREAFVVSIGQ